MNVQNPYPVNPGPSGPPLFVSILLGIALIVAAVLGAWLLYDILKWILRKLEDYFYTRRVLREINEEIEAERKESLKRRVPLWFHRLHSTKGPHQTTHTLVVGDTRLVGHDAWVYEGRLRKYNRDLLPWNGIPVELVR